MRTWLVILTVFAMGVVGAASAASLRQPSPELSAEDVVRTQLKALQANDTPTPDAGIEQVWTFAHPVNKRMTGPLERFSSMLKAQTYAVLLNHRSHTLEIAQRDDNSVAFNVDVVGNSGAGFRYVWIVARAYGGGLDGSWMTVSVSPPTGLGQGI